MNFLLNFANTELNVWFIDSCETFVGTNILSGKFLISSLSVLVSILACVLFVFLGSEIYDILLLIKDYIILEAKLLLF